MERMEAVFVFSAIFLVGLLLPQGKADPVGDKQALLNFVNNVPHYHTLNWNAKSTVCGNWTGVTCSADKSRVIALRLPGNGFRGPIPPNSLTLLTALQVLSLRSNALYGPLPADFSNLVSLSELYLELNQFSGPLPSNFSAFKNLTTVDLSYNAFNGSIPSSISNLTQLTFLNLANNSLSGEIPDFNLPSLQQLNLSNNDLTGEVPKSLRRFPSSDFVGNNVSFTNSPAAAPALPISPTAPAPATSSSGFSLSESAILGIVIGVCVLGFVILALILVACFGPKSGTSGPAAKVLLKGLNSPEKAVMGNQGENNKLVFFGGRNFAFDLDDLLRASAEVLGKGTFGTAYKAILEDATTVVVKRLREVTVGMTEFEQQMDLVGSIKHENVAELKAYYYSKEEKLMVYDYYSQGSVSAMLHGKKGEDRIPLDWETRRRIAVGAARGIARIHTESDGKLVHGNIKASNIFLNSRKYGLVSDLGLTTIMGSVDPPVPRTAGYRAPEITESRKATQASDVYSFGVLLLELLTGKSPVHGTGGEEAVNLVRWVHSVVREEWTAEVFDVELMRYPNIEEEMVEMLQIAMTCVGRMPEQRPKMPDVVKMVQDIRRGETSRNRPVPEIRSDTSTPSFTPTPTPPPPPPPSLDAGAASLGP